MNQLATIAALVALLGSPAGARGVAEEGSSLAIQGSAVAPASAPAATATSAPGRWFMHVSFGVNAYTYLGASGAAKAATLTPDNSVLVFEQVGAGYFVTPSLRLQLTLMAGEAASGNPAGQSSFRLFMAIPWLVYMSHGFFGGAGPLFAPRDFGTNDLTLGLFLCAGYAVPLGESGLTLALAGQAPMTLTERFSLALTPALVLGDRF